MSSQLLARTENRTDNNLDFTQEVRSERLATLWKVTLGFAVAIIWVVLVLNSLSAGAPLDIIVGVLPAVIGCGVCSALLNRKRLNSAIGAYIIGLVISLALLNALLSIAPIGPYREIGDLIPLMYPLVVFIVGLLLPIRYAVILTVTAAFLILLIPVAVSADESITVRGFAILATVLSLAIAAQLSGEIFGIAEWSLENYRKERDTAARLYDTQQEIQINLLRQKALSEQLAQVNTDLEKARIAEQDAKNFRGQFLANMSHELRTPLNAIIGFSDAMMNYPMMYDNEPLPTAYQQDMSQIYNSGKQLLALINDILDLSKVDAGKLDLQFERVDPDELIKYVMAQAAGLRGSKSIRLRRETPENMPFVRGDSLRIRQVMLNLLGNATKFTDQGTITVGARDQGDGNMVFWVADTGIGIPPQDMDTLFEEFRQGSSGRRKGRAGSGLGLAIARQLLKLMNGKIWVESKLGSGSTFYFTLPIETDMAIPASVVNAAGEA